MPNTILCGVDNSEAAEAVFETARWLANSLRARLVLVHAVQDLDGGADEAETSVRVQLGLGYSDDVRIVDGPPGARLLDMVDVEDAEFLVVGSRGRGSIRSAVLGSVSRTLATSAACPVVVVPAGARLLESAERAGASIVCGVDGSEHAVAATRLARALASRTGLRLLVVHALPTVEALVSYPGARGTAPALSAQPDVRKRQAAQIVDDAVNALDGQATGIVETGRPWDVLESVADREAGCLLVVAARGLSGLQSAMFGSVAATVAASSRRPVVVLPERARANAAMADSS